MNRAAHGVYKSSMPKFATRCWLAVCAGLLTAIPAGHAQQQMYPVTRADTPSTAPAASAPAATASQTSETTVRAELVVSASSVSTSQPLRVRAQLFNPNANSVTISMPGLAPGATPTLTDAFIFGDAQQPALFLAFEDEKPQPVRPPTSGTTATVGVAQEAGELRLAPHGCVGVELDLRSAYAWSAYVGAHHIEWRPVGGQFGIATATIRVQGRQAAVLVTDYGKLTFALLPEKAPKNVENFSELVRQRFYDGKLIHRIISNGIIQGGSPDGTDDGMRSDRRTIPAEFHNTPVDVGTLAMARKQSDRDSASCQFFIALARLPELDGQYSVIGQARDAESLRTLQKLGELATDANGRPRRPLRIRSLSLIDDPSELPRSAAVSPSQSPATTQPATPPR